MSHPRHRLDDTIHSPVRFSVMAMLAEAAKVEFGFVRDTVEVSDSVLSKHVTTLEKAGYVTVKKGYVGKRPRTWLSLSSAGRDAFEAHCAALRTIAESVQSPPEPAPTDETDHVDSTKEVR